MPTDPGDVYATCTAAADYVERYGLYRDGFWPGAEYQPGAPVCLYGALAAATGLTSLDASEGMDEVMDDEGCPASRAVLSEVRARHGSEVSIPYFSDEIAASAAEVADLLRDVAFKHQPDEYRSCPGGGR